MQSLRKIDKKESNVGKNEFIMIIMTHSRFGSNERVMSFYESKIEYNCV